MDTVSVLQTFSELGYLLSTPSDGITDNLPLLVYLHGAGERGNNLSHLTRHAIPRMIAEGKSIPAVVLCPQCPAEYVWDNIVVQLKSLIDKVAAQFAIKKDRICLTGSSMGGYGTWMLAMTYSNCFSAIAPVSGGGMPWRCKNLISTPIFALHGTEDPVVPFACTQMMVNALRSCSANVRFVALEGCTHEDAIEKAYEETDLIPWLLHQRRTDFSEQPETCFEQF